MFQPFFLLLPCYIWASCSSPCFGLFESSYMFIFCMEFCVHMSVSSGVLWGNDASSSDLILGSCIFGFLLLFDLNIITYRLLHLKQNFNLINSDST
jgi:hypothetical protein